MSNKIQEGGRRVTVDLAHDVVIKLDYARIEKLRLHPKSKIPNITETLEEVIRKVDIKTLWSEK